MNTRNFVVALVSLLCLSGTALAQQKVVRIISDGKNVKTFKGDLFEIPELGALVVKGDSGNPKVENVMPPEARPKAYTDVDVKSGDEILVLNGKRVKTVKEIEQLYNSIPTGEEVKLGIQRGEEMMISRFAKADPKDLPQRRIVMNTNGQDGDIRPLPSLGIVLGKGKEGVIIKEIADNPAKAFTDAAIKPGDRLVSINGKAISNLDDFSKEFLAVPPGTKMTWIVAHGGKDLTLSLVRPEPRGQVIIKQEKK